MVGAPRTPLSVTIFRRLSKPRVQKQPFMTHFLRYLQECCLCIRYETVLIWYRQNIAKCPFKIGLEVTLFQVTAEAQINYFHKTQS